MKARVRALSWPYEDTVVPSKPVIGATQVWTGVSCVKFFTTVHLLCVMWSGELPTA